ncbi:MAG: phosphate ABC transporter substrate-binding protein [candidate division Zixibacteria bacterium]|nr:phosphate ABC transporter substrate-binding protein [candidate division Zixibacteria bacterium]
MKHNTRLIFTVLALCLMAMAVAQAGEIVVIVNPASSISKATSGEIEKVFMGKSSSVEGTKVVPVDQKSKSPARADFSDKILGKTVKKVTNFWKKQVFSGKGEPPKRFEDDAKVIAYVAENKNAIGYVSADALSDKVKSISVDGKKKW